MPAGLTNHGTILLESANTGYSDTLALAGTFTNAADGVIQVTANSGGPRTITGTLVNQGQIEVDSASYLTITGTYYAAGGSITGPGYLFNCALYVTASPTTPTTILLEGGGDTLETDNLPNTTLWVQGNGYINQNATLNVPDGLTNDGTILLQSADARLLRHPGDRQRDIHQRRRRHHPRRPRAPAARAPSQARWSTRGRSRSTATSYLTITGQLQRGRRVDQRARATSTTAPSTSPPARRQPTTILLEGTGDTLATNNLPNTTLWVQGNGYIQPERDAERGRRPDQRRHHPLAVGERTATPTPWRPAAGRSPTPPTAPSRSTNGTGGARTITGTLVNQGQINVDTASYLSITGTYYAAGGSITGPGYLYKRRSMSPPAQRRRRPSCLDGGWRHAGHQQPAQHDALGAGQRLPPTRTRP